MPSFAILKDTAAQNVASLDREMTGDDPLLENWK